MYTWKAFVCHNIIFKFKSPLINKVIENFSRYSLAYDHATCDATVNVLTLAPKFKKPKHSCACDNKISILYVNLCESQPHPQGLLGGGVRRRRRRDDDPGEIGTDRRYSKILGVTLK